MMRLVWINETQTALTRYISQSHAEVVEPGHPEWGVLSVQDGIEPYVPPPPPTAEELRAALAPLTRRQLFIALAAEGHLSEADAEDAAAGSFIPASIAAIFDTLPTAERMAARITFRSFTLAYRLDPMVPVILLASPNPPDDAALDAMWTTYANV